MYLSTFGIHVFHLQGDSGLYSRCANQVREDFPKKTPFLLSIAQITPTPFVTLSILKMCHNQFGQGIPPIEGKGFVLGSLPLVTNQLIISQLSRAAAAA